MVAAPRYSFNQTQEAGTSTMANLKPLVEKAEYQLACQCRCRQRGQPALHPASLCLQVHTGNSFPRRDISQGVNEIEAHYAESFEAGGRFHHLPDERGMEPDEWGRSVGLSHLQRVNRWGRQCPTFRRIVVVYTPGLQQKLGPREWRDQHAQGSPLPPG